MTDRVLESLLCQMMTDLCTVVDVCVVVVVVAVLLVVTVVAFAIDD